MAACEPRVRLIEKIPLNLLDLLKSEQLSWNHADEKYKKKDPVFVKHSVLLFKLENSSKIQPLLDWCKNFVGNDAEIMQAMFNAIPPNMVCPAHVDTLKFHLKSRRFHIPILNSNYGIHRTFEKIDEQWIVSTWHMKEGYLWELDNTRAHAVENSGSDWRINFIIDIMPGKDFIENDWYTPDRNQSLNLYNINKEFSQDTILSKWSYSNIIQTLKLPDQHY